MKPKRKVNGLYRLTLSDRLHDARIIRLETAQPIEQVEKGLRNKFNKRGARVDRYRLRHSAINMSSLGESSYVVRILIIDELSDGQTQTVLTHNSRKTDEVSLQFEGTLSAIEGGTLLMGLLRSTRKSALGVIAPTMLAALVTIVVFSMVLLLPDGPVQLTLLLLYLPMIGAIFVMTIVERGKYLKTRSAFLQSLAVILPDGRKSL